MQTYIVLNRNEVSKLPYALICEVIGSGKWNSGQRRRKYAEAFTKYERRKCKELYELSVDWHLRRGIPDTVRMQSQTLILWRRLADFCAAL